jgi:hypothetical protein
MILHNFIEGFPILEWDNGETIFPSRFLFHFQANKYPNSKFLVSPTQNNVLKRPTTLPEKKFIQKKN